MSDQNTAVNVSQRLDEISLRITIKITLPKKNQKKKNEQTISSQMKLTTKA